MYLDENAAAIWRRVRAGERITNEEAEVALNALFGDGPQELGNIDSGAGQSEPPASAAAG